MKNDKKKSDIKRRVLAFLLSFFVAASGVLSGPAALPPAKAAAVAVAEESAIEALVLLYFFIETCVVAGGVSEGLDSFDLEKALMDAVLLEELTAVDYGTITFDSGDADSYSFSLEDLKPFITDGSGALNKDVTDEAFARFRVINGGPGSGGGEDPDKEPFSKIQKITFGAGSSLIIADFLNRLSNGEIDGLDPSDYYGTYFDSTYERDADGNYVLKGSMDGWERWGNVNEPVEITFYGTSPYPPALYLEDGKLYFMAYDEADGVLIDSPKSYDYPEMKTFQVHSQGRYGYGDGLGVDTFCNDGFGNYNSYEFNFPVFENRDAAVAFLSGGDAAPDSGMLNQRPYKVASLVESIMETVAPLLNTQLNPDALPAASTAAAAAVQALPEPDLNAAPQGNTDAYKQAVTDAIAEAVPNPEPAPEPSPEPVPEPSPDPEPVLSGSETVKKYKRDLTLIFPFCIPFDLIHFFQVMNADPVAPCFHFPFQVDVLNIDMDVELDMAFLEPVMEIFRMGELGLFILGLILSTSKVIRW